MASIFDKAFELRCSVDDLIRQGYSGYTVLDERRWEVQEFEQFESMCRELKSPWEIALTLKHDMYSVIKRLDSRPGYLYWNIAAFISMLEGLNYTAMEMRVFVKQDDMEGRKSEGYLRQREYVIKKTSDFSLRESKLLLTDIYDKVPLEKAAAALYRRADVVSEWARKLGYVWTERSGWVQRWKGAENTDCLLNFPSAGELYGGQIVWDVKADVPPEKIAKEYGVKLSIVLDNIAKLGYYWLHEMYVRRERYGGMDV